MELERIFVLTVSSLLSFLLHTQVLAAETILSTVLTPDTKLLSRQSRSYYDPRFYGFGLPYDGRAYEYARPYEYGRPERPYYEYARLEYDRSRCGRCDDRYDRDRNDRDRDRDRDRDDRDDDRRDRDGYDDRRVNHRPTYGNRFDRNKNDDDSYNDDRHNNSNNGTDDDNDTDKKRPYDDKDSKPSGSRRDRDRSKYDDRDRYRPDYYDRFLRDPARERDRGYGDPYRERRPAYDRYPDRYDEGYASRYDPVYAGRYDGYGGYRRPLYDDRYDRGYDDGYGGYGPGVGRGPHDRPWDETYRGQAGWDAGGRGYYFASGRPDTAPAPSWGQPGYARPQESGWQNVGYTGYRDPLEYRGSLGYQDQGYRQDLNAGFGQASGWHSVGERRPYRDQSGVAHLDDRGSHNKPSRDQNSYGQPSKPSYSQQNPYGQQQNSYGQTQNGYGQPQNVYGQPQNVYGQHAYGQQNSATSGHSSSTTPSTSYLFQRSDERVTTKSAEETTKAPS
ncbi:uncharacterized protein LOC106141500 [Amyelois transitella]|uniref:uncharacterized protein LOC106141500 n=1 Tax=Amyelois transitella TaxID=680683 RepID=UPI00298FB08E|nr:uncharacterized protein LOC106141500 [Amyelois transitella]